MKFVVFFILALTCSARTLVQSCSGGTSSVPSSAGTLTVSATCGANFTVGNTVVVAGGLHVQGISGLDNFIQGTAAASDGTANTYTPQVGFNGVGHIGCSEGMFSSVITVGTASTVTFSFQISLTGASTATFDREVIVAEYSGVAPVFIPSSGTNQALIFGVPGASPFNLTSNVIAGGATATLTYGGSGSSGGPGTDSAISQMDISAASRDNIFSSGVSFGGTMTAPTASGVTTTFTQRVSVVGGSSTLYFWDSTPLVIVYNGSYVSIL